jgi:hypothetical protein
VIGRLRPHRLGSPALLALAFGLLPLYRLTGQSLWFDELFTVFVARHGVAGIFAQAAADGFTPPLYYLLVAVLERLGLPPESWRVVSVAFGTLALLGLGRLATRLGGPRVGVLAVLLAGTSPFLFSMSQELRPYTAFVACAAFAADALLAWREEPGLRRGLIWAGWLLLATAFSYLGLALLPLALAAVLAGGAGRRSGVALALGVLVAATLISLPGLRKASHLQGARAERGRVQWESRPVLPLARLTLGAGYRPEPVGDPGDRRRGWAAEWSGRAVLGLALWIAWRRRDRALAACASLLVAALGAVWTADALLGLGVTTRYLSLALIPFLLLAARLAGAAPALGVPVVAAVALLQLAGLQRYLFDPAYARDDWRALAARLLDLREPADVVFGFPGHHVAVALDTYAPGLASVGGFTGRAGEPVYLYRPGERFRGYDFGDRLEEVGGALGETLQRRAGGRRAWVVSYADDDWHGDVRPVLQALAGREVRAERFPAREILVLREVVPR